MAAVAAESLMAGPAQRFKVGSSLGSAASRAAAAVVAALLAHLQNEAEILQLVFWGAELAVGF